MQVIIERRKATDWDREDFRMFFQAVIDPYFAVDPSSADRERAPNAGHDAVIPTSDRIADQVGAGHRHGRNSAIGRLTLAGLTHGLKNALHVLFLDLVDLLLSPPGLTPAMKRAKKVHSRLIRDSQ
jgi:hypothetical protein